MEIKLVSYTPDPERCIELSYLACRNLDPWNPKYKKPLVKRIKSMWESGHVSPFEFADATFYITGVSRSCSHQFVRHRLASYEQLSMRSVGPGELERILPESIQKSGSYLFHKDAKRAVILYEALLEDGIPKEDARFILPIGTETRFMAKMNFRSWLHFLRLRTHPSAQWEIRTIANLILEHLRSIAPNIFNEEYRDKWQYI